MFALFAVVVLVAFLKVLNGFLRGTEKARINAVLTFLTFGLIVGIFILGGWKLGFLAIAIVYLSTAITRPLAARVASKLLALTRGGGGRYIGLPPRALQKISCQLGQEVPLLPIGGSYKVLEVLDAKSKAEEALLDYCESQPATQVVMRELQISRNDLKDLYDWLVQLGAGQWASGHWVAASTLAYPETLRYALTQKQKAEKLASQMQRTAAEKLVVETIYSLLSYFERGAPLVFEK